MLFLVLGEIKSCAHTHYTDLEIAINLSKTSIIWPSVVEPMLKALISIQIASFTGLALKCTSAKPGHFHFNVLQ